jgi:plastocyanin
LISTASAGCDPDTHAGQSRAALPAAIPGSGVISGSVAFIGVPPVMKPISISGERCCEGEPQLFEETVIVNPNNTLRNVLVYLEDAPATDGTAQPAALLDQVRCRYTPHVLAVQVGQTLRVRSSDPTMHNVHYMPQRNRARNLAMTAAGHEVDVRFDHPEFIRMKCDVHPWMTAWVGVFENPWYSVTGEDGSFEIKGVPAGKYKLIAWHELYGRREQQVSVADDATIESHFVFGKQ